MSPKLHLSNKETAIEGSILNRSKNELIWSCQRRVGLLPVTTTHTLRPLLFLFKKEKIRVLQNTDLS